MTKNDAELRAVIRDLVTSGVLPPMLPAFENIGPGQDPRVERIVIGTQSQEQCLVCEELGPQVSYTYAGGKVVRLHAACDALRASGAGSDPRGRRAGARASGGCLRGPPGRCAPRSSWRGRSLSGAAPSTGRCAARHPRTARRCRYGSPRVAAAAPARGPRPPGWPAPGRRPRTASLCSSGWCARMGVVRSSGHRASVFSPPRFTPRPRLVVRICRASIPQAMAVLTPLRAASSTSRRARCASILGRRRTTTGAWFSRRAANGHNPGHSRGPECYPRRSGGRKIRKLHGWIYWVAGTYAASASLFHLYTAGYGTLEPRLQRSIHLLFLVPLVFLVFPFNKRSPRDRPSGFDWLWVVLCWIPSAYLIWDANRLNHRWEGASGVLPIEVLLGCVMVLLVIEACRRSLSPWMALTISVSLVYLGTSQWFPGVLHFKGYAFPRMVEFVYLAGDEGMYGFLTGISANILFIYVLFASVMMKAGVGEFIIDVAVRLAGWARGGPAKIAVIASALFGTISGSTVANVYATGSFTIPLMKKGGYTPKNAAAIEAIAGTGGQIMPPVMGAGVFIMAEVTGISYFEIIRAAAIPAILYYVGLFAIVHFLALRSGMKAVPRSELPSWGPVVRHSYFAIPFVLIVYLLAKGYSPTGAAFYTIIVTFVLSFLDRKTWMTPRRCWESLTEAAFNAATIAVALAGSGMIVGVLTRTGAALAFGGVVVQAAHGILIVAMILIFLVVSVLGTGIPTTAAYVISVTVGAAALGNLGVSLLAAHLFVFYYAVLSDLTPPDAVTAFAAANIAGADMFATGIEAFRLGIAGFLVPFAFVYHEELLLKGSWTQIVIMSGFAAVSAVALASWVIGYGWGRLGTWLRWLCLLAAGMMVVRTLALQIVGLVLYAVLMGYAAWTTRKAGNAGPRLVTAG